VGAAARCVPLSSARRGIALPAVLAVLVALALLSSLSLADAVREWRVATLAEDAVRARAAGLAAMAQAAHPPDLATLCLSGPLVEQRRAFVMPHGTGSVTWRPLANGVFRAEAEGKGLHGARHRLQAVLVPDSTERAMALFRCPAATRLRPVAGRWLDGHPEG
jgi:hypothetical protein